MELSAARRQRSRRRRYTGSCGRDRRPRVRRANGRRRASLFFCVPGTRVDGHDFAAEAVEHGAVALVVERRARPRCAAGRRARRARRDGARRRRVLRPADRGARDRRRHRHERQDDDVVPARSRSSPRRGAARACSARSRRASAASGAASSARRPRRSTCSGSSARCSTPATARARWRPRRTRRSCIVSTACGSRRSSSRTSARITSTSTATWSRTSRRSGGSFVEPRPRAPQRRRRVRAPPGRGAARRDHVRLRRERGVGPRARRHRPQAPRPLQRRERARRPRRGAAARHRRRRDRARHRVGARRARAVRGGGRGAAVRRDRRLRAQARRARERAARGARARDGGPRDLRRRRGRRPRPRQAAADGPHRVRARRRRRSSPRTTRAARTRRRSSTRSWPARRGDVEVEIDRAAAIARAIELARDGDVVLIAGKGAEQGQEFADRHDSVRRPRGCARGLRAGGARMIPLPLDEVAGARRARAEAPTSSPASQIDSRRVEPGDLFVAVGGGVAYLDDARARGAAATLVPDDDFAALAALGRAVRDRSDGARRRDHRLEREDVDEGHPRGALRAAAARPSRPRRSYNNEIGLPLTLCRLEPDTEVLRHRDGRCAASGRSPSSREIARPDVGVITNDRARCISSSRQRSRASRGRRRSCWTRFRRAASASCRTAARSSALPRRVRFGDRDGGRGAGRLRLSRRATASSSRSPRATRRRTPPGRSPCSTRSAYPRPQGSSRSGSRAGARGDGAARRRPADQRRLERESGVDARRARAPRDRADGRRTVAMLGDMAELGDDAPRYHERDRRVARARRGRRDRRRGAGSRATSRTNGSGTAAEAVDARACGRRARRRRARQGLALGRARGGGRSARSEAPQ